MTRQGQPHNSLLHHGGEVTATYAYDTRDRCTAVGHNGAPLADYTWLGSAMASRDTTCDYPGGTKPKFSAAFERDGILRVTHLATTHQTLDQATAGYEDLGTWDYDYDASSNELTMAQAGKQPSRNNTIIRVARTGQPRPGR